VNLNTTASALIVGFQRQAVTASNVANSRTPGYQARRVDLVATPGGGVGVGGIARDTRPGPVAFDAILASLELEEGAPGYRGYLEQSNVDLTREFVDQIVTKGMVTANARVLRAQSASYRIALDLLR
jgi:flagellar basal body rod protein FlgG